MRNRQDRSLSWLAYGSLGHDMNWCVGDCDYFPSLVWATREVIETRSFTCSEQKCIFGVDGQQWEKSILGFTSVSQHQEAEAIMGIMFLKLNSGKNSYHAVNLYHQDIQILKYTIWDGFFFYPCSGGNKLKHQHFRLDWSWISLQKQNYVVDEQAGVLEVVLRRRGYLGETSFVGECVVDTQSPPKYTGTHTLKANCFVCAIHWKH